MDAGGRLAEVARELVRRRADLVSHAQGSLEMHLIGVHDILLAWAQPERVRLAGILHSGYSTESFGFRLFGPRERARVRELVGGAAERLVYAFCACSREELLRAADSRGGPARVPTRWKGEALALERRDLAELLVIHAANLAEQRCSPAGAPSPWLAQAAGLLARAKGDVERPPPVFSHGSPAPEAEAALLDEYASLLAETPGSGTPAWAPPDDCPVGEPFLVAGLRALAAGRGTDAAALGRRGIAVLDAWGTAWDKRLRLDRWRALGELLARDGATCDRELDAASRRARKVLERTDGAPERIWTRLDAFGVLAAPPVPGSPSPELDADAVLPPRFARFIAGLRNNRHRPVMHFYPGLRTKPWHDAGELAIVADLERHATEIADEARALETARFQDEAEEIGRTGRWSVLFLHELGRRDEANLARCPTTAAILDRHRTIATPAGLVYFSCLDPGTRVAPHQGPTNMRLRVHLGLEVPDGCGMRVGAVTGGWTEGRCTVIDDSFWHEVWNESDQRRVVLVVDVWHPDLSDDEVALLAGLQRYGIANEAGTKRGLARNDVARERTRRRA